MTKQRVAALSKDVIAPTETAIATSPPPPISPNSTSSPTRAPTVAEVPPPKKGLASPTTTPQSTASTENTAQGDNSIAGILLAIVGTCILFVASRLFRKHRHQQRLAAAQRLLEEQREAEWQRLVGKYGEEIAGRIVARMVWQGMTAEHLVESWGNPVDIDSEIIKARTKETWKYVQTGKNRFANRVYLENGIVIGWKR